MNLRQKPHLAAAGAILEQYFHPLQNDIQFLEAQSSRRRKNIYLSGNKVLKNDGNESRFSDNGGGACVEEDFEGLEG